MKTKTIIFMLILVLLIDSSVTHSTTRIFDRIIAYVNDDIITQRRLDTLVKQYAFELQQVHRYTASEALKEAEKQRTELLDRRIREMLLLEAALTLKIQVTDAEIEEYIQNFKTQHQIPTDDEFKKVLNRGGLTMVTFREQIQRNLMTEKLVMGRIVPRLQVRDSDIQKFFEENRDQLPTKADRVRLSQIFIAFQPTAADRKAATDVVNQALAEIGADTTQFETIARRIASKHNLNAQVGALVQTTPSELLSLPDASLTALAKLKPGEISEPIEVSDGIHVFRVEERTDENISFRLMIVPFLFSEEALQTAREKADVVFAKLETGADFTALAKEYSDDLETRDKGGTLGTHILTVLNPKIQKAVDSLDVGKWSEPIETQAGFYIYKVDERQTPELTQQEKQQIIGILRQQLFEKEWTAYTNSLLENAYVKIQTDAAPKTPTADSKDN